LALKQLEISNDEKEEFDFIQPFPRIRYRKGVIELTMLADVAQSFLELKKGYSEYYIKESLSLEQFNKKRLYELLCSYKKRYSPIWTVYDDELKFLLGMEKEEYKGRPKEFGTKIIGVCINAINDKTSIFVKYIREKDPQGWYTVFTVEEKKKHENNVSKVDAPRFTPDRIDKNNRLAERLKSIGMRADRIKLIVEDDTHHKDSWKWLSDNADRLKEKRFTNPSGVLLVHLGIEEPKTKAKGNE
jgi:plasmid replication initiation protein